MVLGGGAFGRQLDLHEIVRVLPLWRQFPEKKARRWKSTLFLHTRTEEKPCEHTARSSHLQAKMKALIKNQTCWIWEFSASKTMINKFFCLSHSSYEILLQQPELTKTNSDDPKVSQSLSFSVKDSGQYIQYLLESSLNPHRLCALNATILQKV